MGVADDPNPLIADRRYYYFSDFCPRKLKPATPKADASTS
jgi:hypothetical protein